MINSAKSLKKTSKKHHKSNAFFFHFLPIFFLDKKDSKNQESLMSARG
jgi:hypothetical protein